jgi:hypothetical protein
MRIVERLLVQQTISITTTQPIVERPLVQQSISITTTQPIIEPIITCAYTTTKGVPIR